MSGEDHAGVKQPAQTWQPAGGRMHDGRLQMLRLSTLPAALASQQPDRTTQAQVRSFDRPLCLCLELACILLHDPLRSNVVT